jgi:glycosyltransferase involved in cell wall biosynthesis
MLDPVQVVQADLPFDLKLASFRTPTTLGLLGQASVVLAPLGDRQIPLHQVSRHNLTRWVYYAEQSVETRKQMVSATTSNPVVRWRRRWWEQGHEREFRLAVAQADGLQCNGTPTYADYAPLNRSPLLYFDGRVTTDLLPSVQEVERRLAASVDRKLRLLFSGRLLRIKGADHLVDVAVELKKLGTKFELFICGDGELKQPMERRIASAGLTQDVKMLGVLAFRSELVPFVKQHVDLFVCCHRQGDPSCTYMETMSCGVPIVGYSNEALAGMIELSHAGWLVPGARPKLLAEQIARLDRRRDLLRLGSLNALHFARQHTFERTFTARAQHLDEVARAS